MSFEEILLSRPYPPESMRRSDDYGTFVRAPDVEDWLLDVFVNPKSPVYHEEHAHLSDALLGVLWTNMTNVRKGVAVAGTASMPKPHPALSGWDKQIYKWVMHTFFGPELPHFLITLDAPYAWRCEDINFMALGKHELGHCAQATDEDGNPKFRKKDFSPVFTLRGHDVEENLGVVRDFGAVGRNVKEMVELAQQPPRIAQADIDWACGNCLAKAA